MVNSIESRVVLPLVVFALVLAALVTALVPINSADFWWHLKTGDVVLKNHGLPFSDPFTYPPVIDTLDPQRPQMLLRSYWLGQVIYSLAHQAAGLSGIVWLRAGLCAGLVLSVALFLWRSVRNSLAFLPILPLILSLRVILEDSDRPQLMVFVTALLVLMILEHGARGGRPRWLYLLPPLQLIAAQLHPGFAVGTVMILVYAGCALWEERLRPLRRPLALVAALSLLVFFANPNGFDLFRILAGNAFGVAAADSTEFRSPFSLWPYVSSDAGWRAAFALLLLAVPAAGFLVARRRLSAALVLGGLLLAACISMRYFGFLLPAAALYAGLALGEIGSVDRLPKRIPLLLAVVIIAAALYLTTFPSHPNRGQLKVLLQPGYFPEQAADFLERNESPGQLFNTDAWGGYLIYRLWPARKVFIDTRTLSRQVLVEQEEIIRDTSRGRELLERYDIGTVVLPLINVYSGEVMPLVRRLGSDPHWGVVHVDAMAVVFAKLPHGLLTLPPQILWRRILGMIEANQPNFPWAPGYELTRREALLRLRGG